MMKTGCDFRSLFVKDLLTGDVERVSLTHLGEENNGRDWFPEISATGRFVAFTSYASDMHPAEASNLVSGDTNESDDIFVRIQVQHSQFLPAVFAP